MKSLIISLALIFSASYGYSQVVTPSIRYAPEDSVNFEITKNELNFNVNIFTLWVGIYFQRDNDPSALAQLGYSRHTDKYHFSSRLGMNSIWESYENMHTMRSVYGKGKHWNFENNFTYYIKRWTAPEKFTIPLKKIKRSYLGTTYKALKIKAECSKRIGIDAGLRMGTNFYMLEGTKLNGTDLHNNQYEIDNYPFSGNYTQSTFQDYGFLRLGLSFSKISQITINTEKYGECHSAGGFSFSINGYFGLYNRYDNVIAKLNSEATIDGIFYDPEIYGYDNYLLLDINKNSKLSPFGASVRIQNFSSQDSNFPGLISAEVGLYPGEKGGLYNRFFTELKLGFSIHKPIKN